MRRQETPRPAGGSPAPWFKDPTQPLVLAVLAHGALFTGLAVLVILGRGLTVPWRTAGWQVVGNWIFAAAVPVAVRLTRRYPVGAGTWMVRVPLHLAMGVLTSVSLTAVYTLVRFGAQWLWGEPFDFVTMVVGYFRGSFSLDLTIYTGVTAAVHGALYYEGLLDERVAASRLEAELAQSRLRLLRVQLNPHFLFNILNTAASLVYEEPRTVDLLIGRLSGFLRSVLGASETDKVELREELAVTRLYAELQGLRFREGLDVAFEVEDGVCDAEVPSLLLQPLLENAIVHGRDPERPLHVSIRARKEEADVVLEVEDDGRGTPPGGAVVEGFGLGSTRARLRLLHGAQHYLAIEPGSAGGVRVRIRIPYSPWSERSG